MSSGPIAFLLPSLSGGGAERVAINLAEGFVGLGVSTDLIAVNARGELAGDVPPGARLVDFGVRRMMLGLPQLITYLRRERPAAVISFLDHAGIIALWARGLSRTRTRIICTVHNSMTQAAPTSSNLRSRIMPLFLRAFYPLADEIVAVSHGVARDMSAVTGLPLGRIRVIYNPVITPGMMAAAAKSPDHPWFADGGPPVVLGVGRLAKQKDFLGLVRAFALVRRQRPARLLILGEGEERPAIEALIRQLDLNGDVALPGFVAGAPAYMARAGVFVLSSVWEGLPTVLIEALAAGTSVVATDCPSGPREILRDGELGRLVPRGDVAALASAILSVLGEPTNRVPLSDLAEFTQQAVAEAYLRLAVAGKRIA